MGPGASHDLIAHLDKLAARRGYQLAYPAGWALTGREKAALRLVPEQAWQAAIDPRGKVRDCRADDACGNSQCAHRPCWIEEAHGQPPATPRAWHRHFPLPVAHAARRKPRTWPTTKSGPWVCNVLSWREASAQLLRLRGKGTKRNER
jgi:hypothetical protein